MVKFKNNKKVREILYWLYILIFLLFINHKSQEMNINFRLVYIGVLFIFSVLIDIGLHILKKDKIDFYKKIFCVTLIFCFIYSIITPIGRANDEYAHFLRIYEITDNYMRFNFDDKNMFPSTFQIDTSEYAYNDYIENFDNFAKNDGYADMSNEYKNTKLYPAIQYLPQAIGVGIGRLLTDNLLVIGYLGRLFGMIFWILCCTYAIKIIPNKKTFFSMIVLMPIHLITVSALSGDTIINAVSILFIAIIYKNFYNKEILSKKDRILILLTSIMIAVCKIVYLPLVFLILLLKKENFRNIKNKNIFIITVIAISIICGIVGFYFSSLSLSNEYSNSSEQIKFILTKPFDYIMVLINTYLKSGGDYILQAVTGVNLVAQLQFLTPSLITYCFTIVVLLSIFINDEEVLNEINLKDKILVLAIIGITMLLISTAIYVQWTSQWGIGLEEIMGLQGRYFIALILLSIFLNTKKLDIDKEKLIIASIYLQIPIIFLLSNVFFIKI